MFITFEGGEGAGKSTQIQRLAARLQETLPASNPLITREPGDGPFGPQLRALLLSSTLPVPERAELLMMLADRAQHVACVLRPALADGRIVLCDRYSDSSVAYQGYARGLDLDLIAGLNHYATAGLTPDHTFLLDIDPSVGLGRQTEQTTMEAEALPFHTLVREGFLALAHKHPERIVVVDASADLKDISETIWRHVSGWLGTE